MLSLLAAADSLPTQLAVPFALANLGLAGFLIWWFVNGRVHGDKELVQAWAQADTERKRAEAAEAENRDLNKFLREQAVPALARTADALARSAQQHT